VVTAFDTFRPSLMGPAVDTFEQAVRDGELSHDGSEVISRHVGNCVPVARRGYRVVTKDSPDSPDKIDAATAAIIAYGRAVWRFQNQPGDFLIEVVYPRGGEPDLWHEWR
jgi:phage terminase large subunit-like protein